ncbi:hypothetical protein OESDEN_12647 [Oesophagostomum dentatum]|uniref:Uncharacterized protein n=1 Tax=Oesophagostomum dentatum TaxID=61180 RepID=A0A0B1SUL4_OESDE|nr:hypothetical protein OESDEN_12647 [Oesophagostomum dentatum]
MDSWPLLQQPLQEFGLPLAPPLPGDLPPWAPDPWAGELYHHYQTPLIYQASIQPISRPYHDLAVADCQHWNPQSKSRLSTIMTLPIHTLVIAVKKFRAI